MFFGPVRQGRTSLFDAASLQILDAPQAELRFTTHKNELIRREAPLGGETQPRRAGLGEAMLFAWRRRNLEPKSFF
jgi:hypothetical protein